MYFHRYQELSQRCVLALILFQDGSQIMWQNGTSWESKFWAQGTATDGLYHLSWNVDNVDDDNSVPVTIKTTAPADSFKE